MLCTLLLVVTGTALSLVAQTITNLVRIALQRALGARLALQSCDMLLHFCKEL